MKTPTTIQGPETRYNGQYPEYYTDGQIIYKIIDSTCTANARDLLCKYVGVDNDGTFLNKFKQLQPQYKKHAQIISKLGYVI